MARRRSAGQKLIGWGILAAVGLVIVGIFLITRLLGSAAPTAAPASVASTAAVASSASSAASAAPASEVAALSVQSPSSAAAPTSGSSSSAKVAVVELDGMDQASRMNLLNKLIAQGVFTGVEAVGSPPKVGVTPLFLGLNPDLQQQFIATVYAYVNNGAEGKEALQVIDATTGELVGTYTAADGLHRS